MNTVPWRIQFQAKRWSDEDSSPHISFANTSTECCCYIGIVQTNWLVIDQPTGRNSYVNLYPGEVEIGSHYGSGMTDHAGRCTMAEFLKGRFQDVIRNELGEEVLAEVIQAVTDASAGSA
jgi:hypothetical protein